MTGKTIQGRGFQAAKKKMLHFGLGGTIGDLSEEHDHLESYCMNSCCSHIQKVNLRNLAAKLGRDHSAFREKLLHKISCELCGESAMGITLPSNCLVVA